MTKRKIVLDRYYSGYEINNKHEGCYQHMLDKLINMTEKLSGTNSPWKILHVRLGLSDKSRSITDIQEKLKNKLDRKNFKLIWSFEVAKQHEHDREDGEHIHLALFFKCAFTQIQEAFEAMEGSELLKHYRLIENDKRTTTSNFKPSGFGSGLVSQYLKLNSYQNVREAIYWLSYICKVKTKPAGDVRCFGSSQVPKERAEGLGQPIYARSYLNCDDLLAA